MKIEYLFLGLIIILFFVYSLSKSSHKKPSQKKIQPSINNSSSESVLNNINLVSNSEFYKCPLMNKSEYLLFRKLSSYLEQNHQKQGFRLFTQVSMGEFIKAKNDDAYRNINYKRVDFLIIDNKGFAVVVIEYQGLGHFQSNAAERDAIKKEACRKAGIEYLEFKENYNEVELTLLSKILNSANTTKEWR